MEPVVEVPMTEQIGGIRPVGTDRNQLVSAVCSSRPDCFGKEFDQFRFSGAGSTCENYEGLGFQAEIEVFNQPIGISKASGCDILFNFFNNIAYACFFLELLPFRMEPF